MESDKPILSVQRQWDQDRIFLLEDALVQAQHTIEFLHECLVNPPVEGKNGGFIYAYPEQTIRRLEEFEAIAPKPPSCFHSKTTSDCESCHQRNARFRRRAEINDRTEASTDAAQTDRHRP